MSLCPQLCLFQHVLFIHSLKQQPVYLTQCSSEKQFENPAIFGKTDILKDVNFSENEIYI